MPQTQVVLRVKTRKAYNAMPSITKTVQGNSARAAYNFARGTEASAKRRVHVITGNLKRSIHRVRLGYGKHRVIVGMHYGVYEEYGTRYRPPHPYFRPAVEENRAKFLRDMKRVFHR